MGKQKKTKKFALVKRMINPNKDPRTKQVQVKEAEKAKKEAKRKEKAEHVEKVNSSLFFNYNSELGPPYHVILDTNFINFSIQNKLDIMDAMMDCLYAKCTPIILDCVMAELEKLGPKYRVALRVAKDPRFQRMRCTASVGDKQCQYADDCICKHVQASKCFIVATCDRDLKRRIRKIPGVPIMYITQRKFSVERMPEAFGAPKT